jgi:hypothetical protein
MIGEHYELNPRSKKRLFYFISKGNQGEILKVIGFQAVRGKIWNLYFGDITENGFSDAVVSNNDDIYKVMNTVAAALYQFLEEYPERVIRIVPVDDKRKRLYNTIFQRRILEIEPNFYVFAKKGNKFEPYSPHKTYKIFELRLKQKS